MRTDIIINGKRSRTQNHPSWREIVRFDDKNAASEVDPEAIANTEVKSQPIGWSAERVTVINRARHWNGAETRKNA
jgi:hypothetical protein